MAQYNFQMNQYNGTGYDQLYPVGCVPYTSVTLTTSGWSGSGTQTQTVTVNGVLADETQQVVTPIPAIASQAEYISTGVRCTNQAENSLTFTANSVPSINLTVYVILQNAISASLL